MQTNINKGFEESNELTIAEDFKTNMQEEIQSKQISKALKNGIKVFVTSFVYGCIASDRATFK